MDLIITAPETVTATAVVAAPTVAAGARTAVSAGSEYVLTHPNELRDLAQGLARGPAGAPPTVYGAVGAIINAVLKRVFP